MSKEKLNICPDCGMLASLGGKEYFFCEMCGCYIEDMIIKMSEKKYNKIIRMLNKKSDEELNKRMEEETLLIS